MGGTRSEHDSLTICARERDGLYGKANYGLAIGATRVCRVGNDERDASDMQSCDTRMHERAAAHLSGMLSCARALQTRQRQKVRFSSEWPERSALVRRRRRLDVPIGS